VDGQGHNIFGPCFLMDTYCAVHLCKNGLVLGYEVWTFHSESGTRVVAEDEYDCDVGDVDRMDGMLEAIEVEVTEDPPTAEVKAFFKLRKSRFMNTLK
jgi:hypothetical protein